jgi:hypothetical protein
MAASTARAYPNSDRASSHFSLPTLVESSSWPPVYRLLLLKMLEKNKFGTELFRSTRNLSIELGVHYSTVKRMLDRLERGHEFGKKNIVRCEGVLTLLYDANSRPGGKLRRQRTYQLCHTKLSPRLTARDIESQLRGALCPLPPRPMPPASAPIAPSPVKQEHRSAGRSLTPRQRKELADRINLYEKGSTAVEYANGSITELKPGDARYVKPMMREVAILAACQSMARGDPARGLEAHGVALDKAREAAEEMEGSP